MLSIESTVSDTLHLARKYGADSDGACAFCSWCNKNTSVDITLLKDAIPEMPDEIAREAAIFVFQNLLLVTSQEAREQFSLIIAQHPRKIIRAYAWRALYDAVAKGSPAPTQLEDSALKSGWHSGSVGRSLFPSYE